MAGFILQPPLPPCPVFPFALYAYIDLIRDSSPHPLHWIRVNLRIMAAVLQRGRLSPPRARPPSLSPCPALRWWDPGGGKPALLDVAPEE